MYHQHVNGDAQSILCYLLNQNRTNQVLSVAGWVGGHIDSSNNLGDQIALRVRMYNKADWVKVQVVGSVVKKYEITDK